MEAEKGLRVVARLGLTFACLSIALASSYAHASYTIIAQAEVRALVDGSPDEFQAQSNQSQVTVTDEAVLQPGWNLISLPYQPVDPSPVAVFVGIDIADRLCRYSPGSLSLVQYDGFDTATFGDCRPGDAFLLYASGGERLTVPDNATFPAVTIPLPISRPVLIGNPGLSPLSLLDCRVWVEDGAQWQIWPFPDLLANGEFANSLLWFNPISKTDVRADIATEPLYPWRGYWLPQTPPLRCMLDLQ